MPRWLLLLLGGVAIGAGGLVLVQERYLPPRLSADESVQLRRSLDETEAARQRLQGELDAAKTRLDSVLAEGKGQTEELGASRDTIARLRDEVTALLAMLPIDPRGGPIAVRAARFALQDGALAYDIVLSRERADDKPFDGVMQFSVAGETGRGSASTLSLKPVAISIGRYENLRGSLPLPEGFKPRQATISVLDNIDGKRLGMRVMNVKQAASQ